MKCFELKDRGFIILEGADSKKLLQGLITNDINKLTPDHTLYAALLTPQGRYLHDFFIYQEGERIILDLKADRMDDLQKRLSLYKLRSDVKISTESGVVYCIYDVNLDSLQLVKSIRERGGYAYVDPRFSKLGIRVISKFELPAEKVQQDEYELYRISLGIPETGKELITDKSIILECGLDELNAIDWHKGCYLGQELNARTKHRGMVHNRLMPATFEGESPSYLSPIMWKDQKVGTVYSSNGDKVIIRVRLEVVNDLQGDSLSCGTSNIIPYRPEWMQA